MSRSSLHRSPQQRVGRYTIFDQLASGGMATVHLARLVGSGGFSRVVAAKRMHRHFLADPEFRQMFLAEAQLAARIEHPNVVPILDVLSLEEELIIVMPYVHGESVHGLLQATSQVNEAIPASIGSAIMVGVLQGLHAAHEARSESGQLLGIVHRDVSPHNLLVGADGVPRVLDFGIAKALSAQGHTNPGTVKGKFSYMAPEVVNGFLATRQTDLFSAGVVFWELLVGKKLFSGVNHQERLAEIIAGNYPSPRKFNPGIPVALDGVIGRALRFEPKERYATALEFAIDIERFSPIASQRVVSEWVRRLATCALEERSARIHEIETYGVDELERLSLPPAPSLTATATIERRRPSLPTAVSIPRAPGKRQLRRRIVGLATVIGILAFGFGWLGRPEPVQRRDGVVIGESNRAILEGSTLPVGSAPTIPSSITPGTVQHGRLAQVIEPLTTAVPTESPKKTIHPNSKAQRPTVGSARPRKKSSVYGNQYLPSEL